MKKFIFLLLSITTLVISCQKPDSKNRPIPPLKVFEGTWEYDVWINDSTLENKYFCVKLDSVGNDSIEGLFASVWLNGNRLDGTNANDEIETNVWGKLILDSLYVTVQGSYDESASAKAVLYSVNDSSLLWKTICRNGYDIFIPDSVILKLEPQNESEDTIFSQGKVQSP